LENLIMAAKSTTIEAIVGTPPHAKYERLIAKAKQVPAVRTIVVHPCEEGALRGPIEAAQAGIIIPVLVGPAVKISAYGATHQPCLHYGRANLS
jgi:phosphate acetyltransferase